MKLVKWLARVQQNSALVTLVCYTIITIPFTTTRSLANRFYLPNAVSKVLSHGPIGHGVDCLDYYVAKQS